MGVATSQARARNWERIAGKQTAGLGTSLSPGAGGRVGGEQGQADDTVLMGWRPGASVQPRGRRAIEGYYGVGGRSPAEEASRRQVAGRYARCYAGRAEGGSGHREDIAQPLQVWPAAGAEDG